MVCRMQLRANHFSKVSWRRMQQKLVGYKPRQDCFLTTSKRAFPYAKTQAARATTTAAVQSACGVSTKEKNACRSLDRAEQNKNSTRTASIFSTVKCFSVTAPVFSWTCKPQVSWAEGRRVARAHLCQLVDEHCPVLSRGCYHARVQPRELRGCSRGWSALETRQ